MKRPLMWISILLFLLAAVRMKLGGPEEDSPAFQILEQMRDILPEESRIQLSGIVCGCDMMHNSMRYTIEHISIQTDKSSISFSSDFKLVFSTNENHNLLPGDDIELKGILRYFEPASNPGEFDLRLWYLSQNIIASVQKAEIQEWSAGNPGPKRFLEQLRQLLSRSYSQIMEKVPASAAATITLGEKNLMTAAEKDVYREGGIAHLLAVSGLHISLFGMSCYRFLRRTGMPVFLCSLLSAAVSVFYVIMTGSSLSACRAEVMFLIWLGAQICGRGCDQLTALSLTAVLFVFHNPMVFVQSSFWLSFGAVLTIIVFIPVISDLYRGKWRILESLAAGIGIWAGTLPVNLYFYYQTVPWSIVLNLLVLPLAAPLMGLGLLASCLGTISISTGTFVAAPVTYLLNLFTKICELEKQLPKAVWICGRPGSLQIFCFYGILGGFCYFLAAHSKRRINQLLFPAVIVVCCLLMLPVPESDLTVTCLNVGQGDGTLLQFPDGVTCMIDGGSSSKQQLWDSILEEAIKYQGIQTLDYVFLSHGDEDHISGLKEFLDNYETGFLGRNTHGISLKHLVLPVTADKTDFDTVRILAEKNGIPVLTMSCGDVCRGENWEIQCISPNPNKLTGDKNQDSMVLKLSYGEFTMLFTGDLEGEAEKMLCKENLKADILKVGHHGSAASCTEEFLETVAPAAAIISCGKNNPYGHPAEETLKRLEDAGCEILQTQKCGAMIIQSDGKKYTICCPYMQKDEKNLENSRKMATD